MYFNFEQIEVQQGDEVQECDANGAEYSFRAGYQNKNIAKLFLKNPNLLFLHAFSQHPPAFLVYK